MAKVESNKKTPKDERVWELKNTSESWIQQTAENIRALVGSTSFLPWCTFGVEFVCVCSFQWG